MHKTFPARRQLRENRLIDLRVVFNPFVLGSFDFVGTGTAVTPPSGTTGQPMGLLLALTYS